MRTPEEIHRYGKEVIEKQCEMFFNHNNGDIPVIIDENNQTFPNSDYEEWKEEVMDYIKKHDIDKIGRFISLFNSLESNRFSPRIIQRILGILHVSVDNLKEKENAGNHDNPQAVQTTNETEPTGENPPKDKKKVFTWKVVLCMIIVVIVIIAIFYYLRIDLKSSASIATIIGTFIAVLALYYNIASR